MKDQILREAQRLHSLGFAVLPLHPKSKRPKGLKWTSGPRLPWKDFEKSYRPGDNIGVRTGEPSRIGGYYLACIDIDIHDETFKPELGKVLKGILKGQKCPEVLSGSGTGSRHLYCLTPKPFKQITYIKEKNRGEICVYSSGRQMVLPGSIHPDTGKKYRWVREFKSKELPVIEFVTPDEVETSSSNGHDKPVKDAPFSFTPTKVDLGWLSMSGSIRHGIMEGIGVDDRSAFLLTATVSLHSAGLDRDEILSVLTDPEFFISTCVKDRRGKDRRSQAQWLWEYTVKKVLEERSFKGMFKPFRADLEPSKLTPEQESKQTEEFLSEINWREELDKTQHGKARPTLKNLNLILSNSVKGPLFKKDMFANRVAYGANAPWGPKLNDYVQDIDVVLIKHWLGTNEFNMEPKKDAIFEATDLIAHQERVHPVREWLTGLKWDGKSRINTWIKDLCEGEAEEPYLSEVSRKFLLAMVKRIFEPGCQWDYTLVLEGDQGKYKSSIARALASDRWFMDNLPDLRDKDAMLNLQGKWLIELGELTNVKRSDFNLVKQYLIRRIDTVRPHYGRIMSDVPRQSVFIGTVNDGQYLKDPTGNRRFWPVKVGHCDVKGLIKIREQLFAEAFHYYKKEVLMLSPEATLQAVEAQDDRRIDDDNVTMEEALKEFMDSPAGKEFHFHDFKSKDLLETSDMPWFGFANKSYVLQTAAQVLKNMGFERIKSNNRKFWTNQNNVFKRTELRGRHGTDPIEEDFY